MFFVFNKEKIYAYLVSVITVILLFCAAGFMIQEKDETIQASSSSNRQLPIYNVETNENKVAFTMNCAW